MNQAITLSGQAKADEGDNEEETENKPTPKQTSDIEVGTIHDDMEVAQKTYEIYKLIRDGATAFLWAEYRYLAVYIVVFAAIISCVIGKTNGFWCGIFAAIAFLTGAITSIICGWIGMFFYLHLLSHIILTLNIHSP